MDAPEPTPAPENRNLLVILGAVAALVAGLAMAWVLLRGDEPATPPPASEGGLVIESADQDGRIDPARPLRCFVAGQYAGELTLADCARRNGVATDALDVGVDETGALAAAQEAGTVLTPLPPEDQGDPAPAPEAAPPEAPLAAAGPAACWRYAAGQWRRLPGDMDLSACAQTLFAGRCERPGQATYGRWGQQTLRLVAGRLETSSDNQTFRTLAPQGPNCSLPPLG